ncbi:MAG: hypothetical protein QM749_01525 [Aquabacterium sp.]
MKAYNNPISGMGQRLTGALQADVDLGITDEANGIGTPSGVKAKSQETVGTPAISIGYYLTGDYSWFVEAYLLAAPLKVTVKGDGVNSMGQPLGINGVDIINSQTCCRRLSFWVIILVEQVIVFVLSLAWAHHTHSSWMLKLQMH